MQPLQMIQNYKCKINITDYDFACLMLDIYPISLITELQNQIDKDDLDSEGIETHQHITVVYDIDNNIGLSRMLNLIPNNVGVLEFGEIGIFENDKYDVLKISVVPSNELLKLRTDIIYKLQINPTHDDYKPHITLAYLKKGTADKYLQRFGSVDLSKETILFEKYNYSSGNINETFTKL